MSELTLEIDGEVWEYWSEVTLREAVDEIAQVTFVSVFDPDVLAFREMFRPFQYRAVKVYLGGEVRFAGTLMSVDPNVTDSESTVTCECYATCGVLADVTVPEELFPAEFKNVKLSTIAEKVCEPFGITARIEPLPLKNISAEEGDVYPDIDDEDFSITDASVSIDEGPKFEKVQFKPGQNIMDLLIDLAHQRGLIITSETDGNLLFHQASQATNDVVAQIDEDSRPATDITPSFSVQDYYSHITGISKSKGGKEGSKFTVSNPNIASDEFLFFNTNRPLVYELNDTEPADVPAAVTAKMGRMFANTVKYELSVSVPYDASYHYWEPNRFIKIKNKAAMIYNATDFLIRAVELTFTPQEATAQLDLVLPGSLSGEIPESMPWDE